MAGTFIRRILFEKNISDKNLDHGKLILTTQRYELKTSKVDQ